MKVDDEHIRSAASTRWRKVAFVIGKVAEQAGAGSEKHYEAIAERIRVMVADGHLIAEGDLSDWRHSEVRLPEDGENERNV